MNFANFLRIYSALALLSFNAIRAAERPLPVPQRDHPGNVFLAGELVAVSPPPGTVDRWDLVDYDGQTIDGGAVVGVRLELGQLAPGWYELRRGGADAAFSNHVSLAVLPPLKSPTPLTSPIALDVAMAWFYPPDQMPAAASLCALAGVNWVRDRLSWPEMEPQRRQFAPRNRYDESAAVQARAGLRELQVAHISPRWANTNTARFPLDLRDAYDFWRAMAARWRGEIEAFEPWNEADIENFGGHTGSEIASFQKASYLGLKAGNPRVIACQNVFALHSAAILQDFAANEAAPYFDTFNLHHYVAFDQYPAVYADFRAVAAGKPLWVTEASLPVKWSGDEHFKEPTATDLRLQAERVPKTFASSLHEGAAEMFYFLLPHYSEGQTQFGLLRPDLTPRPAYVALAAAGRLLADARPLGRLRSEATNLRAFAFQARPDGQIRDVIVAWTTNGTANLMMPRVPESVFDHLGRPRPERPGQLAVGTAPRYFVFPRGVATRLPLQPPPATPPATRGRVSPVVLQALLPAEQLDLKQSAHRLTSGQPQVVHLRAYNFGLRPVNGRLTLRTPPGWVAKLPPRLALAGNTDADLALELLCPSASMPQTVRLEADFAGEAPAVLSFRLLPGPAK